MSSSPQEERTSLTAGDFAKYLQAKALDEVIEATKNLSFALINFLGETFWGLTTKRLLPASNHEFLHTLMTSNSPSSKVSFTS